LDVFKEHGLASGNIGELNSLNDSVLIASDLYDLLNKFFSVWNSLISTKDIILKKGESQQYKIKEDSSEIIEVLTKDKYVKEDQKVYNNVLKYAKLLDVLIQQLGTNKGVDGSVNAHQFLGNTSYPTRGPPVTGFNTNPPDIPDDEYCDDEDEEDEDEDEYTGFLSPDESVDEDTGFLLPPSTNPIKKQQFTGLAPHSEYDNYPPLTDFKPKPPFTGLQPPSAYYRYPPLPISDAHQADLDFINDYVMSLKYVSLVLDVFEFQPGLFNGNSLLVLSNQINSHLDDDAPLAHEYVQFIKKKGYVFEGTFEEYHFDETTLPSIEEIHRV